MVRIRQLREERRMTQRRLSMELGVAQETVSGYESGKSYPSVAMLIKLAGIFDVSIDYLLGVSDVRKPMDKQRLSNQEVELLQLYKCLSGAHKERLKGYAQGLLDGQEKEK